MNAKTPATTNHLFAAARDQWIGKVGRMSMDDVWKQALAQRGDEPYPTQAALQRGWRWAVDSGLIKVGKHLASRRSFNVTPFYEWV